MQIVVSGPIGEPDLGAWVTLISRSVIMAFGAFVGLLVGVIEAGVWYFGIPMLTQVPGLAPFSIPVAASALVGALCSLAALVVLKSCVDGARLSRSRAGYRLAVAGGAFLMLPTLLQAILALLAWRGGPLMMLWFDAGAIALMVVPWVAWSLWHLVAFRGALAEMAASAVVREDEVLS